MKVSGKRHLDKNTYVVIIENGDVIKAYNVSKLSKDSLLFKENKKLRYDKSFTNGLKHLSDEEISDAITDKFLGENNITEVTYSFDEMDTSILSCGNSSRKYVSFNGFRGHTLESIWNKYNIDRYKNVFSSNVKRIELYKAEGMSSYEICEDTATINIGFKDGRILDNEIAFLTELLNDTFTEKRPYTETKDYELESYPFKAYINGEDSIVRFVCSTSVVEICNTSKEVLVFEDDLIRYCIRIMNERHEKMKNSDMKYQLKMEGF